MSATDTPTTHESLRGSGRARRADPLFRGLVVVAATSVLIILAAMIARTTLDAWPVFDAMGFWGFLSGQEWKPQKPIASKTGQASSVVRAIIAARMMSTLVAATTTSPPKS
ncbi:MAG: hypothetical protein R6T85_09955, partial [Egibacteraceae bacterium]